jgi:hypothetical protein
MKLLHNFIEKLTPEERDKLKAMGLKGKEKDLLLKSFEIAETGEFDKDQILEALQINYNHFRVLCFKVLRKCYKALAGEDDLKVLDFLNSKMLYDHLFSEIHLIEKKLIKEKATETELRKFYQSCFDLSVRLPNYYYEEKTATDFANKYLAVVPPAEKLDEKLIIEARMLFNKINQLTVRYRIADVQEEVNKEISQLEKHVNETKDPRARYYIYKTSDLYCVIYKSASEREPYLQKMMTIIEKDNADLPEREKGLTMFKLADVLYDDNKIEEAHNFVYKLYNERPDSFKNFFSGFHILIETSILLKKYDIAELILNKEFTKIIEMQQEPFCTFALLNYAKLYLHKADYEKALGYIIETKKLHNKTLNAAQEVQIRIYENIYFYLSGDVDFAKQLVSANLKFCEYQKIAERNPQAQLIFDIINACIKANLYDKPLPQETLDAIQNFQKGTLAIFGRLLLRMAPKVRID